MATSWASLGARSARAVQGTTETAPVDTTVGISLIGVDNVLAIIYAPNGQTFTGTGTLLGYVYGPQGWVRAPRADLDMADAAGLASVSLPVLPVCSPAGYFLLVPSGVGLSGGTQVTTDYVCTAGKGSPSI